jgi:hypothetical protein
MYNTPYGNIMRRLWLCELALGAMWVDAMGDGKDPISARTTECTHPTRVCHNGHVPDEQTGISSRSLLLSASDRLFNTGLRHEYA